MRERATMTVDKKGGLAILPSVKAEALDRIQTVVGHVKGIEKMIEEERYCIEILKQIAAVQASLAQISQTLTKGHMKTCMTEAIHKGRGDEKIEELIEILKYL